MKQSPPNPMQETDNNDLCDDADYAASVQHQASLSLSRSDSDKGSVHSVGDGYEVVYCKDNVAIHPTQHVYERIRGRLRLIKQGSGSLSLTWIPYKPSSNETLTEKDRSLYTINGVPLADVRSIRRQTPTLGWQYIIVVLTSGLAFPPLYFYSGGVRELLATLKQHAILTRSADDANVFLVNDFRDPLQRSLSSLELPGVVTVANGSSKSVGSFPSNENSDKINGGSYDGNSNTSQNHGRNKQKHDPARDLSIHVLEKFSLVTKFARHTTSQIIREIKNDGSGPNGRKSQMQSLQVDAHYGRSGDTQIADKIASTSDSPKSSSSDAQMVPDETDTTSDSQEFDKLALVWGKPRQPPLRSEEWASFLDAKGRIMNVKAFKKRIFYGGVEHGLRKEVWKFLLGYYQYDSTYSEREALYISKKSEYQRIKTQWQNISPPQAKRFTKFRERKGIIEKDVVRTDRSVPFYEEEDSPNLSLIRDILLTYSFYNFDLGYCQGMNDFLSPILYVMKDESESFWCFVSLMERLGANFDRDQNGMHSQLFALLKLVELLDSPLHNYFTQNDCLNYFFCFRWILIQFKREFEYEKTMRLWEVLWTHYLSEHLHLYVCVAILKRHRKKIIDEQMDFDTLLKFINELSGHIDLNATLREAEALCICAGENGAACIPPGTPPSLPMETELLYTTQDEL